MARTARASVGGVCCHVLNRGNGRQEVFHKKEDYVAFLDLIEEAGERLPMRLLAWCLIPKSALPARNGYFFSRFSSAVLRRE